MAQGFDYVIVGAGSAGCVLAARLSEDPRVQVLLVEAGSPASSVFVHMPAGIRVLYTGARHNWRFWTEPQPNLSNRSVYVPRGRVVGGSSSINSMIAIRGNPQDYDAWAAGGLPSWGFESLRPYFRKIEDATLVTSSREPDRGYSGPIRLSYGTLRNPVSLAFIEGALGKDIRKWFTRDFYDYHVRRYKKRPIYWLFASPKGSFQALIYMHRYRPDTVSVVLNYYLREYRNKLEVHRKAQELSCLCVQYPGRSIGSQQEHGAGPDEDAGVVGAVGDHAGDRRAQRGDVELGDLQLGWFVGRCRRRGGGCGRRDWRGRWCGRRGTPPGLR